MSAVKQHLVPEPRIQQVQHGVLGTADIQIHRQPLSGEFRINKRVVILGIDKPHVVPARPGPLGHTIGLALETRAIRQRLVEPLGGGFREQRLGRSRRFEVSHRGQCHGQVRGRVSPHQTGRLAVLVEFMPDREWLAPVALAAE